MDGLRALEVDHNTDGCIFGADINENGTESRNGMCHFGLGTSSIQEIVNHAQSKGAVLIQNNEEVPDFDQDNSREVEVVVSPNELEIDAIKKSRNRFGKSDQKQADIVCRFKHATGVPLDSAITC